MIKYSPYYVRCECVGECLYVSVCMCACVHALKSVLKYRIIYGMCEYLCVCACIYVYA